MSNLKLAEQEMPELDRTRLSLVRSLFGSNICVSLRNPQLPQPTPLPEEAAGISARAVEKRRQEFAAGRAAARDALALLGRAPEAIPIGGTRAPVWPKGIVGSITHTKSCAMAAVAHVETHAGLGLDVEEDTPLKPDLWDAICSTDEQRWMRSQQDPARMGKLIFSAKEAAYKCQYLLSEKYYGFDGMALEIDMASGRFLARFTAPQDPFEAGDEIAGRFAIAAGLILTTAELPRSLANKLLERRS